LKAAALQLNIPFNLEPVDVIYSIYRYTWIDIVLLVAFALPPLIMGAILVQALMRLRSTRSITHL
jgi:hypothetical protein